MRQNFFIKTVFLTFMVIGLGACAGLDTRLPDMGVEDVRTEQEAQEKRGFAEMARLEARLDQVAHRILRANQDICDKTGPNIGIIAKTVKSFPKALRDGARRELGLSDDPQMIYIRPFSPAAKAGLAIGDRLVNVQGNVFKGQDFYHTLMNGGAVFRQRGEDIAEARLKPEMRCDYRVELKMTSVINAYATGKAIIVTAGMMNFVQSDDELAYIIGHELAHNTHSHIRKSITNYILSLGGLRYTRPFEAEADYVGVYYMERAGYDSHGVEDIWRRLALQSLHPIARAKTHPAYPTRALQIEATRKEIDQKRQAGEALIPNLKSPS